MNIAVIAPHPDDEILGCGGSLLRHATCGDSLAWIIVTSIFEKYGFSRERVDRRQQEIKEIARQLGIQQTYQLEFPTMQLHSGNFGELIAAVAEVFGEVQPERIYVPNRSDIHSDHRFTFEAVMSCTKSFRRPSVKQILMYETISETEFAPALPEKAFLPNYFIDITDYFTEKRELLSVYKSETGSHPFPRSRENLEALALFRGATVGVRYAEAFQLIRLIEK